MHPPSPPGRRFVRLVALSVAGITAVVIFVVGVRSPRTARAGSVAAARGRSTIPLASPAPAVTAVRQPPRLGAVQVVETDDVGDPFILPAPHGVRRDPSARYVLFWTTDWESNVPTAVSSDLVNWRRVDDALPVLPAWATESKTMTWAPSALAVSGGWVLYYSTQEAASRLECLGAAFSQDPAGPYVDSSPAPLGCQRALGGSIDPSVVPDTRGAPSLVWKSDGNSVGAPVSIWQQRLSPDGRALVGSPHRLLSAGQPWQHGIVEGPAMLAASKGGWWLFYSGGAWQSNTYATGVAWCAAVSGPCTDTSADPFLAGLPSAVSPGGLETFVDNSGRLWAAYSAFPSTPANTEAAMAENRVLEIAPITSR